MSRIFTLLILAWICSVGAYAAPTPNNTQRAMPSSQWAFKENKGQVTDQFGTARSDIHFQLNANGTSVFIGRGKIHYQWNHVAKQATPISDSVKDFPTATKVNTYRLDMELVGFHADAVMVKEEVWHDVDIYYTRGLDGARVHAYQKVTYHNIYPNIDWVLYVKDNTLKYDFIVRPGGKVSDIQIRYKGATDIAIKDGAVVAVTPMGSITEEQPFSYNQADGNTVPSRFILNKNVLGFEVDSFVGTLVIDPELRLEWGTYYGGSGWEGGMYMMHSFQGYAAYGNTVIADHKGEVYMAGTTASTENIATVGAHQTTLSADNNAFLVKFNPAGQRIWATYYGGTGINSTATVSGRGHSIACDTLGNIYMAGNTFSDNGLATPGAYQDHRNDNGYGWPDLYLAKFKNDGTRQWATYFGNPRAEEGGSVAVTPDGSKIYLAGASEAYPPGIDTIATPNAYIPSVSVGNTAYSGFLACFDAFGQRQWGTYLADVANIMSTVYDITLDKQGNVFLTGYAIGDTPTDTLSIASLGSFQAQYGGCVSSPFFPPNCMPDAFLQKWDSAGNRLWGTYYGGDHRDGGYAVACDDSGNVYMAGFTDPFINSINGPYSVASLGSFIDIFPPDGGSFLAKFSGLGQRLWATYYQGNGEYFFGSSTALACSNDKVFLLANTSVEDIATPCAYQTENPRLYPGSPAGYSTHIAIFGSSGSREYATYYGGQFEDWGSSLAAAATTDGVAIYMTGATNSPTDIATVGSYKSALGGQVSLQKDAFLAKFILPVTKEITVPCFSLDSVQITARDTLGSNYGWSNGATGYNTWVKTSGSYIVSYQKMDGCPGIDTFLINIYPMPLLATQKMCVGQGAASVAVEAGNTNIYTYRWYRETGELVVERQSDKGDTLSGLSAGNYKLQILAAHCDTTLSFAIETYPEVALMASNDTLVAAGNSVQLWATGADYYQWEPEKWLDNSASATPVATPQAPVSYTVTGYDEYGCSDTLNVHIDINEGLFIPNAFSPNGDGLNDEFKLGNFGYHELIEFRIFNRWGEEVFFTTNPKQGWEGSYKGKPADFGTYPYYVRLLNPKGEERTFKGDLTLIR